jgi:hypothetical protein
MAQKLTEQFTKTLAIQGPYFMQAAKLAIR